MADTTSSSAAEPQRPAEQYAEAIAAAEAQLAAARQERDDEMRRLHAAGVTMYRLAKWFGISQQAVRKIVQSQPKP